MNELKMPKYSEMDKMQKAAYIIEWIIAAVAAVLIILYYCHMLDKAFEIFDFLIGIDCLLSAFICWKKSKKVGTIYLVLGLIIFVVSIVILIF
jgi:hypothetical protein